MKQYQRAEQPDSKSLRMTEWKDGKLCSGTFGVPLIPTGLAHSMQRKSNTIEQLNGSGGLKYDLFKALHLHLRLKYVLPEGSSLGSLLIYCRNSVSLSYHPPLGLWYHMCAQLLVYGPTSHLFTITQLLVDCTSMEVINKLQINDDITSHFNSLTK